MKSDQCGYSFYLFFFYLFFGNTTVEWSFLSIRSFSCCSVVVVFLFSFLIYIFDYFLFTLFSSRGAETCTPSQYLDDLEFDKTKTDERRFFLSTIKNISLHLRERTLQMCLMQFCDYTGFSKKKIARSRKLGGCLFCFSFLFLLLFFWRCGKFSVNGKISKKRGKNEYSIKARSGKRLIARMMWMSVNNLLLLYFEQGM